MNAEASNPVSGVWASLEGHIVDGVFPLRRCLGTSDHSAVFLTEAAKPAGADIAIKLVPVISTPTAVQLSRWLTASALAHPHLLRIFEAGKCEVDGQHYLYAVMEYADQTLAQLLESRAMTQDEAREMLAPALNALAFLHGKGFVQGHLKPANVLVVGDQLKLASDTNRLVDEVGERVGTLSVYHPPEGRDGRCSTEGDIWALGVTMCEALTRRQPSGLRGGADAVVLPDDLPPAFDELIARCLSRSPHDRPKVVELEAWLHGRVLAPAAAPIPESEAIALLETVVPVPPAAPTAAAAATAQAARVSPAVPAEPSKLRILPLMFIAFAVFVLAWAGLRAMRSEVTPAPPPSAPPPQVAEPVQDALPEAIPESVDPEPLSAPPETAPSPEPVTIHEVIPDVPRGARLTIRGTVTVSVRVIVEQDGTVFAALAEDPGPSRYFERRALDAAKQWAFPAADTETQRFFLVRFAFTRDGTTARVVPLR